MGKIPVEVNDGPGFVSNRVLIPMINEAVYCLMDGTGSAENIDNVMKLGMNHPMGPLALADLIGLDVCLDIMNVLYDGFNDMLEQIEGHEKALRKSEIQYRTLFEQATDAIFIADSKGKFIDVSPSACKLIGYAKEESLGLSFDVLIPKEDLENEGFGEYLKLFSEVN